MILILLIFLQNLLLLSLALPSLYASTDSELNHLDLLATGAFPAWYLLGTMY